jgi:hypothetical protein
MSTYNEEVRPPDLNPKSLDFGTLPQGGSKTLQELIRNPNKQPLLWLADTGGPSWLTLDKSTGTLQPGEQQTINVMVDAISLAVGGHIATLTFTSEGDERSVSEQVLVTLVISPVIAPAVGLTFATLKPESSSTLPLLISNMDSRTIDWSVDTGGTSWLNVVPITGTLQPGEHLPIHVTANSHSLIARRYLATLTFTSKASGIKSAGVQVPVLLYVGARPDNDDGPHFPRMSANALSFSTQQKGKSSQQLVISNQDDSQVDWTLDTGGVSWLTVDRSAGTLQPGEQTTVNMTVDSDSLAAGTYHTHLKHTTAFHTISVGQHPTTELIPVTLTVS